MPITLRDFITFPFNGGRGIRTDQLDGEIAAAQLAADAGMPVYLNTGATYTAAQNRITLTGAADPPVPSLFFAFVPNDVGHKSNALTIAAGSVEELLHDPAGDDVSARRLSPGALIGILRLAASFRLSEHPPTRPVDYAIRSAASEDDTLTTDEIGAGTASVPPSRIARTPDYSGNRYVFVGVPDETADITSVLSANIENLHVMQRVPGTVDDPDGVAYKWWRWSGALNEFGANQPYEIIQGT